MYEMSDEEFEQVIQEALDAMPDEFLQALQNVAIVMEDEPNEYHLGTPDEPFYPEGSYCDDELLGLFDGLSLVERADGYDDDLPDVITIFKGPHERCFDSREEVVEEVGLLGLFDGLSLVERADGYDDDLPDVITIFKGPHERCFDSREEVVEEVGKTVIHEIGHYFGIDDDRLYEMGY